MEYSHVIHGSSRSLKKVSNERAHVGHVHYICINEKKKKNHNNQKENRSTNDRYHKKNNQ